MEIQSIVDSQLQEISRLQTILSATESKLRQCQQPTLSTSSKEDAYTVLEEFISIFTKQYLGMAVGAIGAIVFRFFDQKVASRLAKKYNIRQKELTKAAFPTLICFVQFLLRKRSRNSKLAALLSVVKNLNDTNKSPNRPNSKASLNQSPTRKHSKTSPSSTPRPLSSFSSIDSEIDSVFHSSNSSKKSRRSRQSMSARYVKNSHVSINVSTSPKHKS